VGKTTFAHYLSEQTGIEYVPEVVEIESDLFKHRKSYPEMAQIAWFGKFLKVISQLPGDWGKQYIVDRSPYNFVPYTQDRELAATFFAVASDFKFLLRESGESDIWTVFLTASKWELTRRIKNRNRSCIAEELRILQQVDEKFMDIYKKRKNNYDEIYMVAHDENERTIEKIKELCETFFV